jgi:hypothetical protein
LVDNRIFFEQGTPELRAEFETPHGIRQL